MTWNHRIVKYHDGSGYGLHEVYYDAGGSATAMTDRPIYFAGETPADVVDSLRLALGDAENRPVFEEPAAWATKPAPNIQYSPESTP